MSTNFDKSQPAFSEVQLPAARWEDVSGCHGVMVPWCNANVFSLTVCCCYGYS